MTDIDSSKGLKSITTTMEIGLVRDVVGQATNVHDNLLNNQSVVSLVNFCSFIYTYFNNKIFFVVLISLAKLMELESRLYPKGLQLLTLLWKLQSNFSPIIFQNVGKSKWPCLKNNFIQNYLWLFSNGSKSPRCPSCYLVQGGWGGRNHFWNFNESGELKV